ncbi:ABC transporter ATP-binding protein [Microvirga sp. M2]|uniref:ABC transporter ATP-binding protein n=1 Tax=Microvirga sp. M2 TaxID=3073270 RepID=UPI0039C3B166
MIEIERLTKSYDGMPVVDDVSMRVDAGTITAIVGTSGSGKSTLMRMINRLVEPSSGLIRIDGELNTDLPAHELRRRIGYVIQGHGLFPHRTVAENIAIVPRLLGWDKARIALRIEELLHLFQLDPIAFAGKYPHQLSGGQQQRIGVARALAAEPSLLLMDEPFGALDPIIRSKAQDDLLEIQRRFGITVIVVTHDMEEAFHLGDRIAVMDRGRILQDARPVDILAKPANDFVQRLVGMADRPFRLLSMMKISDAVEPGVMDGLPLAADTSLRDAISDLVWAGRDAAPVVNSGGTVLGSVSIASMLRLGKAPA